MTSVQHTGTHAHNGGIADPAARQVANEIIIEQIMREMHVGRRHAYSVLRQRRLDSFNENVPVRQRDEVLVALYRDRPKDVVGLFNAMHGVISTHDVTKTLWSLQKTNHVKFRERLTPSNLYALRLTALGESAAKSLINEMNGSPVMREAEASVALDHDEEQDTQSNWPDSDPVLEAVEEQANEDLAAAIAHSPYKPGSGHLSNVPTVAPGGPVERIIRPLDPHALDVGPATPEPLPERLEPYEGVILRPWPKGDLSGWPAAQEVRDRWIRTRKLSAAAKLLEEAGEDEMALTLMGKTEFTPLELEVAAILRAFGELESE